LINKNIVEPISKSKKCIGVGLNSDDFGITNENELVIAESAV